MIYLFHRKILFSFCKASKQAINEKDNEMQFSKYLHIKPNQISGNVFELQRKIMNFNKQKDFFNRNEGKTFDIIFKYFFFFLDSICLNYNKLKRRFMYLLLHTHTAILLLVLFAHHYIYINLRCFLRCVFSVINLLCFCDDERSIYIISKNFFSIQ